MHVFFFTQKDYPFVIAWAVEVVFVHFDDGCQGMFFVVTACPIFPFLFASHSFPRLVKPLACLRSANVSTYALL